tara:strand:- start:761 stop:3832 length:3072 start_codon:yes stop_codon:yes gene_type:complete
MNKFISYFIKLTSFILIPIFFLVFISENTEFFNNLYKQKIINAVESESNFKLQVKKIIINWDGLNPKFILNDISIFDKDIGNNIVTSKKFIIKVNIINTIIERKIVPEEFNLVNSNLKLLYKKEGLFLKNYNLLDLNKSGNDNNYIQNAKLRITDSNISLLDKINNHDFSFKNINLVLFKHDKKFKLFSTFNYGNKSEIIHFASDFSLNDNNKLSGNIYSKGVNLNISNLPLKLQRFSIKAKNLHYTFWAELKKNIIKNANGSFAFDDLFVLNNINKKNILINKSFSNFSYTHMNKDHFINFDKMTTKFENKNYENNVLFVKFNNRGIDNIYFDKLYINSLKKISNIFPINFKKSFYNIIYGLQEGLITKINIHNISNIPKIKFSMKFSELNLNILNTDYLLTNLSGSIIGNYNSGVLSVDSDASSIIGVDNRVIPISIINGNIYYKTKGKKIKIYSNKINIDNNQSAKITGVFSKNKIKYRMLANGNIKPILNKFSSKYNIPIDLKRFDINSMYELDYRVYKQNNKSNTYGVLGVTKFSLRDKLLNIATSIDKFRINFFDKYIISNNGKMKINNDTFKVALDTNYIAKTHKYSIRAVGNLSSNTLKSLSKSNALSSLKGKSLAEITVNYSKKNNRRIMNGSLKTYMEGMSFDILSPFKKISNEKKLLKIKYNFEKKKRNILDLTFDIYDMRLTHTDKNLFMNISSPYLKGEIIFPNIISSDNRLQANLQYLDFSKFQGKSNPIEYSFLNISAKKAKIKNNYFNNFKVQAAPSQDGLTINHISFINQYLTMNGTGKWVNSPNGQITFFNGDFTSDNFGASLNNVGYKKLIKKGILKSKLIGQWEGSPDIFSLKDFNGKIILDLKKGEFLQVTKETQAIGQLLGLFSIASLQKRLSLDFSDFFSSGLSFDTMNGEFEFTNSIAKTNNFNLKGSFGEMRINGTSNIKHKTHKQNLTYIPDLSSMSLISGTLLGGPIGAVASIFYDKVLKQIGINTNELAAVEYSIIGPWDNPKIKLLEPFKPIPN